MDRTRALVIGAFSALVAVVGCGGARVGATASSAQSDEARRVSAFQEAEDDVLRRLAAIDRRFAARARLEPREPDLRRLAITSMLAEDPTLGVIDGTIDPFSFDTRGRGLATVQAALAKAPSDLPVGARGMLPSPALERELLERLVAEEIVRLEEERMLPRSASALVRGIVETWSSPTSQRQAAERDRWLARRLGEIRTAVTASAEEGVAGAAALDVVRARELDDALDALEHAASSAGLVLATAELVKLREALEAAASRPAAVARSDWRYVARRVRVHLGITLTPEALGARLTSLEQALRGEAEAALGASHLTPDAVANGAAPLVFAGEPCAMAVPGSRLRSMSPPPERAAACRLRQTVASADDATSRVFALVAMHDHVVIAQWALDVATGSATIAEATGKHRTLSSPGPHMVARWERLALARPTAAIGGGLAAGVLSATADHGARARAWAELGEVPLDVAERELSSREPHGASSRR